MQLPMVVAGQDEELPTVTVADCRGEVPPGPVHWKVKVVFVVRGFVKPLPESVPEFDQFPLGAAQLVAFIELHVSVDCAPEATLLGEAERVAVGAGLVSAHDAVLPPPDPTHCHCHWLEVSDVVPKVPALQL